MALTKADWEMVQLKLGLSDRETQVVEGIVEDLSERTIARKLGIKYDTVHSYVQRVYRKLNVHTRLALSVVVLGVVITELRSGDGSAVVPCEGDPSWVSPQ